MDEDSLERNTEYQNIVTVFSQIVRVGKVTAVNYDKRIARVKFPDLGYTSDWIPVLISQDTTPDYKYTDPQWTEFDTEDKEPQDGDTCYVPHKHKIIRKPYMPVIGDQVLCLYEPVRNGRGFILGGIQTWQ